MSKSRRFDKFNNSNKKFGNKKKHPRSGWEPKRDYSDRDINRRAQRGEYFDDDEDNY